jgi:CBS domain-containing protein
MTNKPQTCDPGESLEAAVLRMAESDCGAIPVLADGHRLVGILTDRDACITAAKRKTPLSDLKVSEAMSATVATCKVDDPVERAEERMRERRVRRVPVLDSNDKDLVGMVSLADLVRAGLDASRIGGVLAQVSRETTLPSEPPHGP